MSVSSRGGPFDANDYPSSNGASARSLNSTAKLEAVATAVIRGAAAASIAQTSQAVIENFATVMQYFSKSLRNRPGTFRQAFIPIAERAQAATVSGFAAGLKGTGGYRSGATSPFDRDAGGHLAEALESPNFFRVGADGIDFGNKLLLDAANRGWRRLNYGAGKDFSQDTLAYSFLGGSFSLDPVDPIPEMFVPSGFWQNNEFYPLGYLKNHDPEKLKELRRDSRIRKGSGGQRATFMKMRESSMEGSHYLDAGMKILLEELPAAMEQILLDIAEEAATQGTGPAALRKVDVTALNALLANLRP